MSTRMKTSELIGPALDWAVAKCEGYTNFEFWHTGAVTTKQPNGLQLHHGYSTDWARGGPIIERELIDIQAKFNSGNNIVPKGQWYWQASTVNEDDVAYWFDGPTPLIAAMRCYVASKLGDEVEVPEELK